MSWRDTTVAPDQTHHLQNGAPLYEARFHEVLKFHSPGLAPVLGDNGAMHIDVHGEAVYATRFRRTFGFYGGRAAVDTGKGWAHILPTGEPLTTTRYGWCGNYMDGRCTVRHVDGRYGHLDLAGEPLYPDRWSYAGDYRYGIAVVQRPDGLHTHIDECGRCVHAVWFLDLDVFHKGFARARDAAGWMHIDRAGSPRYERRFATVEPFYNGQARVERFDGALEVVDESGGCLVELRPGRRSEFSALSSDLVGFWKTDTIAGAVRLGVIEAMPASTEDAAHQCGLDLGRLDALLRALCELSLVRRADNLWHLTDRGQYLLRDHPMTLADAALEYAGPLRELWSGLPGALGRSEWTPPDVFGQVASDPTRVASHHRMLRSYARHDYAAVSQALDLRGDERVLDVAGGVGVLSGLLLERHPALEVVLLERPEVLAQLPSKPRLVPLATDLFDDWDIQADCAVLARVLHDWDDERALRILKSVRATLPSGGKLFLIEMIPTDDGAYGGLCDLHLLLVTGGRERTATEYRELLTRAGFEWLEVRALPTVPSVIVGVAR